MTAASSWSTPEGLPRRDDVPPVDEAIFEENAVSGSAWTGSRLLVGTCSFLFGTMVFAYFYLRSINSHGLWRLPGQQPPIHIGVAALACVLACAAVHTYGLRRLRSKGLSTDWRVGAGFGLLLGLVAAGLDAWDLGRLHFQPGSSGFSSVFVAWQPVYILVLLGAMYWLETLLARSVRLRWLLRPSSAPDNAPLPPEVTSFRASVDSFSFFIGFLAVVEVIAFALFYL